MKTEARRALPSPKGTNFEKLFLPAGATGYAFDAAPARMGTKMRDAMVRHLVRAGLDDESIDEFLKLCAEPAEDGAYVDGEWDPDASPEDHVGRDGLPNDSGNGLPKHAIAGESVLEGRRKLGLGMDGLSDLTRRIKVGPA